MNKILIICAAGASSTLIAEKTEKELRSRGFDAHVESCGYFEGKDRIREGDCTLYLNSPQTRMYFKSFSEDAAALGRPIIQIPQSMYLPLEAETKALADLIEQELQ